MSYQSQDKNMGRVSFMTEGYNKVDFSNQKAQSPIYNKQGSNVYRKAMFTPPSFKKDNDSREINIKSTCMDLEDQINSKIKDLEHKYNSKNVVQFNEGEMLILGEQEQSDAAKSRTSNNIGSKGDLRKSKNEEEFSMNSNTPQNNSNSTVDQQQPNEIPEIIIQNVEKLDKVLEHLPKVNNDDYMNNHNDSVLKDINILIENFERIFVTYINENYRSFTERDLQRLIQDELKLNLIAKIKEMQIGQANQNCDPFKIQSMLMNAGQLKSTNEEIRESIHKSGVTINQLAKTSYDMKNNNYIDAKMERSIRDIAVGIDTLNHLFNDVHLKVLENDSELTQIEITCGTTLSSHGHLKKFDKLEQQYKKLDGLHKSIKQQLFDQTCEYKQLQNDYETLYKTNQNNSNYSQKIANMEQMLDECRSDNKNFIEKIETQQAELFCKERTIDKMRHQLKHGVIANGISPTFDHEYSGQGGTIATGSVQSKIELASDQQKLLSMAQNNQLKWRNNALTLIRLTQRMFGSMNQLQKSEGQTKHELNMEKAKFETCKKDLESTMKNVKFDIDESDLSVVKQGAQFMEEETKGPSTTMNSIKTLKNMLNHQQSSLSKSKSPKRTIHHSKLHKTSQTDFESNEFKPISAPNISHYKPQELIRLEVENNQLTSELETLKLYQTDLENEITHLTECIKETKTKEFLKEQDEQRKAKQTQKLNKDEHPIVEGESILKKNDKLGEQVKEFESSMLNVKQNIKETNDLVEESKKNNFTQEEQARQPLKKKKDEEEDPIVVEERIVKQMNDLIIQKDQENLELTVQRQRQDEIISSLQSQLSGLEKIIIEKSKLIDDRVQANLDEQELHRMRSECAYLQEKVDSSQREILRLEEEIKNQQNEIQVDLSAQLASQIQCYNNLQTQLDEERVELTSYRNQVDDQKQEIVEKGEAYIRLQLEFNQMCRVKQDVEAQVDELKNRLQHMQSRDNEVEQSLRDQLRRQDEQIAQKMDSDGLLQRDLSSLQLQNRDLNVKIDRQDQIFERQRLEISTQYQQEIMNLTEEMQSEISNLKQQNNSNLQKIDKLQKLNLNLEKQIEESSQQLEVQSASNNQNSSRNKQLETENENLQEQLEQLKDENERLNSMHDNQFGENNQIRTLLQNKIQELNSNLQKETKQKDKHVSQIEEMKDEINQHQAKIGEQTQLHIKREMSIKERDIQIEELQQTINQLKQELQHTHDENKKQKHDDDKLKEDDFWSRPSQMEGSGEKGIGSEDMEQLDQIQEKMQQLAGKIDSAKKEIVSQIQKEFKNQIAAMNQDKKTLIKDQIAAQANEEIEELVNDKVKIVNRIVSENQVYFIVHQNISLQDQITKSYSPQVYMIEEDKLQPKDLQFLMNFVPQDEKLQIKEQWLEQFENDIKQINDDQLQLNSNFQELKQQLMESIPDEENEEIKELQRENLRIYQENLDIKTQNNQLIIKNIEERKRIQELNYIIQQKMMIGRRDSESNQNEKQISYGKNFDSFFGGTNERVQPSEAESSTIIDLSRLESNKDQGSSDGKSPKGDEVMEHIKTNLKMYLNKTPIIDTNNEIILQIVFSMLNMTKQEISDLKAVRLQLPVYKIDEKASKKAQKAIPERSVSDPYGDGSHGSPEQQRHSTETASKSKFLGLFKKGGKEVSEGSFGGAKGGVSLGSVEESKQSPAPFQMKKQTKDDDSD